MASLNKLPPVLPEINREAWVKLGNLSQDLNRLLNHLDSKSPDSELTRTELFALRRQIKTLRFSIALSQDLTTKSRLILSVAT